MVLGKGNRKLTEIADDYEHRAQSKDKHWIEKCISELTTSRVTKQAVLGGGAGWVTGFVSMKLGKGIAGIVGTSLILFQLAAERGYVMVDWRSMSRELKSKQHHLVSELQTRLPSDMGGKKKEDAQFDRFVDDAESHLESYKNQADSWLGRRFESGKSHFNHFLFGDKKTVTLQDVFSFEVYVMAFTAGTMLGISTGKVL